jgi:hypothetical protein
MKSYEIVLALGEEFNVKSDKEIKMIIHWVTVTWDNIHIAIKF